jgi:hypothetical protein
MEKLSNSLCFYSDCMRPACAIRHTRQALGYDVAVCWFHAADHERATVKCHFMKENGRHLWDHIGRCYGCSERRES